MLRLIEGSYSSEAPLIIREEIKNAIASGKKAMLIVPEQQTVAAEKEFVTLLGDSAPTLFEVTNFTRFSNSVFRALGGVDKEYCDTVKSSLIMWRALSELAPTLSVTDGKPEVNYGMVKRALATTQESDGLALGTEELEEAKEKIGNEKRLSKKLDDLIRIRALYKKLLSEKYADSSEDIGAAVKMLRENSSAFRDTEFFIEGFTSFTEPQYKMVELLIGETSLSILLDLPKSMRDSFEYSEILLTEKRLVSSANRLGQKTELRRVEGVKSGNENIYEICRYLWRKTPVNENIYLQNPDEVRIFEASDPYTECDFIISDIRRRVMLGASYSDFAVIAGDISRYAGILDVSAKGALVPLFISKSRDASSFEAIKLIYTALSAVSGGFMREDVISHAKCGLSSITREECDALEIYCEKWGISGRRFTDGVAWNMNPDGYSPFKKEDTDRKLVELDRVRRALIEPLTELCENLSSAVFVKDYAAALYSFMRRVDLYGKITARSEELYSLGEAELATENERIYKAICDSLDTLVEVCGDAKSDLDGFIAQLKITFSAAAISKIPSYSDSVVAVSAGIARLSEKKHIYILGANRGELPTPISSDSYFTDKDKEELAAVGLPFESGLLIKEAKSLYSLSRALLYAKESVTLTYSIKNADYTPQRRSEAIDRILDITSGIQLQRIRDLSETEISYSPTQALLSLGKFDNAEYEAVKKALDTSGYGELVNLAEQNVENTDMALTSNVTSKIYPNEIELSQSKIDSYNNCPLAYFCRYDLKLEENDRAKLDARNIGSFIHAILENFFTIVEKEEKSLSSLGEEQKAEMIQRSASAYIASVMPEESCTDVRTGMLIKRLVRASAPIIDGLCDEFSDSRYLPKYFELRIGGRGELCPELLSISDTDGTKTLIKGSVDRVDAYKFEGDVYVRVADYKTGQKDFKPEDLEKGQNLQMFLYLSAIIDTKNKALLDDIGVKEGGRLIPAGVIYVKSDLSDVKISHDSAEDEKKAVVADQKRQGMMLDDAVSVAAMSARYLPVRLTKDGGYYKGSDKFLYTEDSWKTLRETVEDAVRRVTRKMRSGDISARPLVEKKKSPCEYCKFKPICRNPKI